MFTVQVFGADDQQEEESKRSATKLQKSYFDVLGLCCSSEVALVENILKPLNGVKEVSVILPSKTVIVVHDSHLISQIQIDEAMNQASLESSVKVHVENYKKKWPSPYAIASGVLLLLSLLKYVYSPLQWLALGAVAAGIFPILMKCVASIRNLKIDINILVIIAVIGTIAMSDYVEAGTIVFLFTIAEWLESRSRHKANAVMSTLMSMAPQKAVLAATGDVVDVDMVELNTILAVKAGEVIPIDGIVVDGEAEVDEKTLTGESYPVAKLQGSTVWAGTVNLNGYISVKTTALAEDCVVAEMAKLVEEAQNRKSKTQKFVDRFAKFYTPAVLFVSVSVAVIPAALHVPNWSQWFHLALVVLEKSRLCFDKTGTITSGEFFVTDFQSLREDISLNTLLYWVASIERKSSHPMADALVEYGRLHSIEPKPENVEDFQSFPGQGIHGRIDGQDIYIGNRKIALRTASATVPTIEESGNGGKTIGYIYCGGTPAGIFALSDACRLGAAEAVRELKKIGIKTALLTGDSHTAAIHTNEQLEQAFEVVYAELLPEEKARIVNECKMEGYTAMVGDGINDAPALATADIGISMGISGSALAQETGNVILMSNDIRNLPKAIRLAKKANRKVIENVTLSMAPKLAVLALAFAGHPLVWAAVLADAGTCVLVILNSMLLLQGSNNKQTKGNSEQPDALNTVSNKHSLLPCMNQQCCSDSTNSSTREVCKQEKCCTDSEAAQVCNPQKCCSERCGTECLPGPSRPGYMPRNDECMNSVDVCDSASCKSIGSEVSSSLTLPLLHEYP
ncbi:hypothetical protein ACLB2K_062809 [Fragaria x ananassa]